MINFVVIINNYFSIKVLEMNYGLLFLKKHGVNYLDNMILQKEDNLM
jgi:hypothetical protein